MGLVDKALSAIGLQRKSAEFWSNGVEMGRAGSAGEIVTGASALSLSAVWGCANLISGTISSLPLEVHRRTGDGMTGVDVSHPLHAVIYASPNYDQTALDFWDYNCLALEMWGNSYSRVERSGGRVVALYPINPEAMAVRRGPSGDLSYRWSENGKYFERSDRDVLHIRGPGGDPLGGMSTLKFGREAFSTALAADRAAGGVFKNGLRPSGVISMKEWMTPEQRALTDERLGQKYAGAINSGRPFIAEGGMTYQHISMNPDDAQMLESRQFGVEEICRFFGVPPVMIGHSGESTAWPTSVEQQMLVFQIYTLRRRVKRIEQAVEKQLLTPEDRAAGVSVRFNIDALLRGDSASRSAFYVAMSGIGAMTINEIRGRENLPPVEGGNVPRMQMQNVPITQTGADNGTV